MTSGSQVKGRPRKGARKGPGSPPDDRLVVIHLKGSLEYVEWLEEAHEKTRLPKTTIMRVALEDWAKRVGLRPPPKI